MSRKLLNIPYVSKYDIGKYLKRESCSDFVKSNTCKGLSSFYDEYNYSKDEKGDEKKEKINTKDCVWVCY
jgi:hypothetical protein